jgi:cleavage stimulation factor subunit 3
MPNFYFQIRARNFERVEKLFQRCLLKVLNIELWKTYLTYVKDTKASLANYKEKMAQAYEFALNNMGMDFASSSIYNDYIMFVKNFDAAGSSYAENQKISAIRRIYHRGVIIPMLNVENLWKDYIAFEQGINPMIAEKLTGDKSRDYMNARRVSKEYEAVTRGLDRSFLSLPPCGSIDEIKQVEIWQKYIAWERSNPLRIEDHNLLNKRVMFGFEQCLLCLGHFPNIWYTAASHLQECARILADQGDVDNSKTMNDQVVALYEKAISNLHAKNLILYLAFADF